MKDRAGKIRKKVNIRMLIVISLAACLLIGGSFAKYVTGNMEKAEMLSDDFYISGEYIEYMETPLQSAPEFTVSDMSDLSFDLYNYEKKNTSNISKVDIDLKIETTPVCEIIITDPDGAQWKTSKKGEIYTMAMPSSGDKAKWNVKINPGNAESVKVEVSTVKPYKVNLKAVFNAQVNKAGYTIEDKGNYRILTIHSNDYNRLMTVTWNPENVSPDNTNPIMASWKDSNPGESFKVERNNVYELIFVENKEIAKPVVSGTGESITVD